jgi:hypothetical protein
VQTLYYLVGFEVMTSSVAWDITPCSSEEHVASIFRFEEQAKQETSMKALACHLLSRWFLAWLILRLWRWKQYYPLKHQLYLNGLHCVIFQKIKLFIHYFICHFFCEEPLLITRTKLSLNRLYIPENLYSIPRYQTLSISFDIKALENK